MKNKILLASAVSVLMLSGCSSVQPDKDGFLFEHSMVDGKSFVITHLNDKELDNSLKGTINFSVGKEGLVSGRGFCDLYNFEYDVDNSVIHTGEVEKTNLKCSKVDVTQEHVLFDVFEDNTLSVSKTPLGYKLFSDKGSFGIMEINYISHEDAKKKENKK